MKLKIPREAPPVAERPTGGPWGELPPRGLEGVGIEIAHANLFGRMVAALMVELPKRPT